MKIAYIGLDLGMAVLRTLLEHGHEVVSVYYALDDCHSDSQLAEIAQAAGIPSSPDRPSADTFSSLSRKGVDFVLVNGYPHRLPISSSKIRGVNIHPTLLPEGRGPWPFPWTILKELRQTGITTHKLVEGLDAGDILLQTAYRVDENETYDSLIAKFQIAAPQHILRLISDFENFWHSATPQNGGTTWPDTTRENSTLNWNWGIVELARTIRAFGSSGCFASLNGTSVVIRAADNWPDTPRYAPGTLVTEALPALVVAAADGYLLLRDYEYEGRLT